MANKRRKCKQCKVFVEKWISVPCGIFCNYEHAIKFADSKQLEKSIKKERKFIKEGREKLKTAKDYIKPAQRAVNNYIKIRDINNGCISCGNMPEAKRGGSIDAGHYRSIGSASHMRFNILNIHSQCVKCNKWLDSNPISYRISLIKKVGLEIVDRIETDNTIRKHDITYLKRVIKIFNKRTRIHKKILANKVL